MRLFAGVVAALALLVPLYKLGDGRTLTSHEAFVAVTTREMLVSGDWLVPRYGGTLRLTKPPLAYWVTGLLSLPAGDVSEFTARLPSALSSLGLVLLVGVWTSRWYGRAAGMCAGLIQATSLWHTLHAREATVDMLQCLLMAGGMFLAATAPADEPWGPRHRRWFVVYVLLGLQFLAKFVYGPALVLAPLCVFWLVERRVREFRNLLNPLGLGVFAVLALAWPWYILHKVPNAWQIWQHETFGRALGAMRPEPAWYFVPLLLYLMLPWALLYPAMLRQSWERSRGPEASRERFLWTWILVQFVLISLSSNKHKNYLVPALPAIAILLGPTLERALTRLRTNFRPRLSLTSALAGTAILAGVASAVIVSAKWPYLQPTILVLGSMIALGGTACVVALHGKRFRLAGLMAAALFAGAHATVVGGIIPGRDYRLPMVEFARTIRQNEPQADICLFGMGQSTSVYYLGLPVHRVEAFPELVSEVSRKPQPSLVLTYRYFVDGFHGAFDVEPLDEIVRDHPAASRLTEDLVLVKLRSRVPATGAAASMDAGSSRR